MLAIIATGILQLMNAIRAIVANQNKVYRIHFARFKGVFQNVKFIYFHV